MKNTHLLTLGLVSVVISCATPKAALPDANSAPVLEKPTLGKEPEIGAEPPVLFVPVDDGIRMPDMLSMPTEGDFRATNPGVPSSGSEPSAVISRPPTDPPSRVNAVQPTGE